MNCADIAELTPLYLARELSAPELRAFEAHLNACGSCAEEIELQVAMDARLRASVGSGTPETTALDQAVRRQIRLISLARRRRFMAAAAAIVLSVAGSTWWLTRMPRIYADAARDHRLEVVEHQPRGWRSGLADVNDLAGRFGLSGVDVRRLAPADYRLEHAKICRLDGEPALHLVYANSAREVSLYVRRPSLTPSGQSLVGKEYVDVFHTARFSVIVVSAGSRDECWKFAQAAAITL